MAGDCSTVGPRGRRISNSDLQYSSQGPSGSSNQYPQQQSASAQKLPQQQQSAGQQPQPRTSQLGQTRSLHQIQQQKSYSDLTPRSAQQLQSLDPQQPQQMQQQRSVHQLLEQRQSAYHIELTAAAPQQPQQRQSAQLITAQQEQQRKSPHQLLQPSQQKQTQFQQPAQKLSSGHLFQQVTQQVHKGMEGVPWSQHDQRIKPISSLGAINSNFNSLSKPVSCQSSGHTARNIVAQLSAGNQTPRTYKVDVRNSLFLGYCFRRLRLLGKLDEIPNK